MSPDNHRKPFTMPKPEQPPHAAADARPALDLPDIREPQRGQDMPYRFGAKNSVKDRLLGWIRGHRAQSVVIAVVAVGLLAGGAAWAFWPDKEPPQPAAAPAKKVATPPPPPPVFNSPLTGVQVPDEATTKRQVTAIMIENSPDARPQSGLKTSGVVFEAIAEGGITRFLVLYQEERPGLIGPVRSLRPYYVDWLAAFDAAVAHVGGSYTALNEIRSGKYKDIDQFFNPGAYWRSADRYAPHNVYTNFDRLDALNQSKGFTSSTFTGFPRKKEAPSATPNATSIDITVSSGLYNVHYDYDKAANNYARSQGGAPHDDREGGRITPKVVIVMRVPVQLGFEDGWREQMTTIGSGQTYVFQDGTVQEGTWTKGARTEQISFKDAAGKEIALNPGQTWITVVAPERGVTWQ